jgi:hypothetical protein
MGGPGRGAHADRAQLDVDPLAIHAM